MTNLSTPRPLPATDDAPGWRRHVLALSMPVILSNATVPLVGIADTAVMGRMGDAAHLSAVAVGAVLFGGIFWAFGFLRMATGGLVAQALGAGDVAATGRVTIRALATALAIGLALVALQVPLLALGLRLMEDDGWQALARTYFHIRMLAAPATLMGYALLGTLVGLQRVRAVLALQLLLNLSNVALNIAFFTLSDLGIAGVAWATVIAEYLALGVGLWLLRRELRAAFDGATSTGRVPAGRASAGGTASGGVRPDGAPDGTSTSPDGSDEVPRGESPRVRDWLLEPAALARFFTIGGDLFVRTLCLEAAFYWLAASGSRQGVEILAANAVLVQLLMLMSHALDGYAHAAETLTGFATGRRDPAMLERALRASTALAAVTALAITALYALGGGLLVDLMTTEPGVRELARHWLPWIVLAPLVGVWSFLLDGVFVGATRTREMRNSMLLSLPVFVLASLVLVPPLGNHGLWLAYYLLMLARTLTLGRHLPRLVRIEP